ncbi:MAG: arsenate reductase ArsC [Epsilonproteobacteria bacterium]|nr:arsenate reductase ArsC [Campylobacterota bacterium]
MKKVLIICTGNSCRSILAEGLINKYLTPQVQAKSCGSKPSGKVNKNAKKVLEELNAWRDYYSKSINDIDEEFDLVISVCDGAKEECGIYPKAKKQIHIPFNDPDGKDYTEFKKLSDEMLKTLLPRIKKELGL